MKLQSTLERFDSNLWHFHVVIPQQIADTLINGKDRRVICTINGKEKFQAALMPIKSGNCFININKKLRDKLKLNEGDLVSISLEKDNSEYGLPMPEEFAELLNQDEEGNEIFQKLTPGKQRTLLYIAGNVKNSDLRIKRAVAIIEHLKATDGKIDYKQLNILLKA